jgi:CYTH domain-containing protein/predicted ATPase
MSAKNRAKRIVLTGGPCAGKTSALSDITKHLASQGIKVFSVPEVASILIGGGADLGALDIASLLSFERNLIELQLKLEDTYIDLAARWDGPSVVICDRGTMDVSAYLPPHIWKVLLDGYGWTEVALRDQRYDAIIHLVSAAIGAEDHYTTENNAARNETPDQAAALDRAVQSAWVGHPHLRVVDSASSFETKIEKTLRAIDAVVGSEHTLEVERKFLVDENFNPDDLACLHKCFYIEQTYLKTNDGSIARVRRRHAEGAATYTHTVKRAVSPGIREETERQITGDEYIHLLAQASPEMRVIHKQRRCFLWESQYFELDTFIEPRQGLSVLELEVDSMDQAFRLPPFIPIKNEVTTDETYTNYALAMNRD